TLVDDEMGVLGAGDRRDEQKREREKESDVASHLEAHERGDEGNGFTTKERRKRRRTKKNPKLRIDLRVRRHALRASGESCLPAGGRLSADAQYRSASSAISAVSARDPSFAS